LEIKDQKKNCPIFENLRLLYLKEPRKGSKNRINIEENIAITPSNLFGTALNIA
jgi:hypothetical protein